jgi:hypothetical protein
MFGKGGGEELAREMGLPFLGSLAMRPDYRDSSKPTVLVSPAVRAEYETVLTGMKASLQASATAKR